MFSVLISHSCVYQHQIYISNSIIFLGLLTNFDFEFYVAAANQFPPVLYKNNTILAHTGGYTTITHNMLMTSDKDTPFEKLKFRIIKPPANGNLMKIVDGKDNLMLANAMFSPKELMDGRIRFHHDAYKPLAGKTVFMYCGQISRNHYVAIKLLIAHLMILNILYRKLV